MDKKKIRRKLILKKYMLELLQLTIGTIIMALGVAQFLLPNKLSSGGFSGIATIPYYFFGWTVGKTILVLNIPCFTLAFIRIGKEFKLSDSDILKRLQEDLHISLEQAQDYLNKFGK